jgi:hypothetical protein
MSGPAHPAVMILCCGKVGHEISAASAGSYLRRTHKLVVSKIELVHIPIGMFKIPLQPATIPVVERLFTARGSNK